jgi:hypothetical protein
VCVSNVDCVTQCGKSARQPETTAPSTTGDKRRPTDAKPEDDYCAADWSDDVTVDWFNDGEMALGLSEENNNNSDGGVQQSSRGFENDGHDPPLMKKSKLR